MELKIKQVTFPEVIEFNFDELKQEITTRTSAYVNLIYDDNQMKEAKKDVANLRKFTKALSDERIKVKKDLLKPYEDFEKKINELTGIVNAAINNIDSQIKQTEEQKKQEKITAIERYFEENCHIDWLKFNQIFDPRWANASVSLKSVCEAINATIEQIKKDLASLSNLPEFAFEAIEVYKSTLDMNKAISEGMRLAEIQKRKAEAERLRAEREEAKKQEETFATNVVVNAKIPNGEEIPIGNVKVEVPARQWISFKALLNVEEAKALREFFESRDILFDAI